MGPHGKKKLITGGCGRRVASGFVGLRVRFCENRGRLTIRVIAARVTGKMRKFRYVAEKGGLRWKWSYRGCFDFPLTSRSFPVGFPFASLREGPVRGIGTVKVLY